MIVFLRQLFIIINILKGIALRRRQTFVNRTATFYRRACYKFTGARIN